MDYFARAHPSLTKKDRHEQGQEAWIQVKKDKDMMEAKMQEFKLKISKNRTRTLETFSKKRPVASAAASTQGTPTKNRIQ